MSTIESVCYYIQRPTAHELLKHRFLKVARKTSYLTELIDRYQTWRVESGEEEEQEDAVDGGRWVHSVNILTVWFDR